MPLDNVKDSDVSLAAAEKSLDNVAAEEATAADDEVRLVGRLRVGHEG
jgi:hypothetical protein